MSVDYEAGSDSTGTDSTGADSTGFESDFFAGVCFALDFLDSEALQDLRAGTCYFGLAKTVEWGWGWGYGLWWCLFLFGPSLDQVSPIALNKC